MPDIPSIPPPRPTSLWQLSFPVAMGYVPLGAVFGFLLVQAGAAWWAGPLMSVFVFAGAAQFMVVPMLAAEMPIWTIALATVVINFRHVFYGLSLLHRLPANPWAKGYLIWALSDENYSLLSSMPSSATTRQMLGIVGLNHFWWVLGTLLGSLLGVRVSTVWSGIEFALAALFAVLVVEQWRASQRVTPIVVAVVTYAMAVWLLPSQALALSMAASVLVGVVWVRGHAH